MANLCSSIESSANSAQRSFLERPAPAWLLCSVVLFANCGGKSHDPGPTSAVDAGDSGMANGGSSAGSSGGTIASRGGGSASGGAASPPVIVVGGSSGTPSGECDPVALWKRVTAAAGLGYCDPASVPGPDEKLSRLRGAVVIDDDGRVIDNTGLKGDAKQSWLDELDSQRWPCLAGQVIGYKCSVGG